MNTAKSCSVTLRIASKAMKASDITDAIGVKPSDSHDMGEVLSARSAKPRLRSESLWLLEFDVPDEQPLEDHLDALLSFTEQKQSELSRLSSACDIEVFCSFSTFNGQGGFVLDHVLAQRMAETRMDFVFDLYLLDGDDG